ncbi:hypothetical protein HRI_003832000 [Hibiscus trionum]|uniref:Non-specific lipid-transfer protein n=1 Tax=Hibiscus trionum TaxID=183268 RepID=A0A9W7MF25_HIBTR|nr:hypothetical protein HRI_003832000 [Hibiscus trionum]
MATSLVPKLLSLMLLVSVALEVEPAEAAMTCGSVVSNLLPCMSYVSTGGPLPAACCSGVKTLYGEAQTSDDLQSVCKCIKSAVNGLSYSDENLDRAAGIPGKCGLSIPYKISPSTDCSK